MKLFFVCILLLFIIFAASCTVAMVEIIADVLERRARRKRMDDWERRLP